MGAEGEMEKKNWADSSCNSGHSIDHKFFIDVRMDNFPGWSYLLRQNPGRISKKN